MQEQRSGSASIAVADDASMPLPPWLTRIYYIFPIVLYIPDAIFNFYVYANGLIDFSNITIDKIPYIVLWAFLATGLVGMAWLLSVLAPWHWVRRNHFQSIMCWIGVVIATSITIWNSLAYRAKETSVHFPTDLWFAQTFHADINAWSPTTVLVAVAPPFWGLFWAIVQPAERKRSRAAEEADFQTKLERMRQEAELKRMKAEANAQIREAQLKGLAATMRAARDQISGPTSGQPQITVQQVLPTGEDLIRLVQSILQDAGNQRQTMTVARIIEILQDQHYTEIDPSEVQRAFEAVHDGRIRSLQAPVHASRDGVSVEELEAEQRRLRQPNQHYPRPARRIGNTDGN